MMPPLCKQVQDISPSSRRGVIPPLLERAKEILGQEKAPLGREGCKECRIVEEVAGAWGNRGVGAGKTSSSSVLGDVELSRYSGRKSGSPACPNG